jgi:hypothetical protein
LLKVLIRPFDCLDKNLGSEWLVLSAHPEDEPYI